MSDKTIYHTALERLQSDTDGSNDFEKVSHILAKSMYLDYNFTKPEGGQGTQDGGYDGYDSNKNAKLACSIQKTYKEKIKSEVEKSKKNGDKEIFYFSNQKISQVEKNQIKETHISTGIEIIISGIDELSQEIEKYLKKENNPELYDLLGLSFLKVGEYYNRNEVKPFDIDFNGAIYKKKVIIENKNTNIAKTNMSENPLLNFIFSSLSKEKYGSFKNISLCGIGYLGKTFLMKTTFNALINEFSDKNNYSKYKSLPFIQFYELKHHSTNSIISHIKNNIDPILIFLDGLDELNEGIKIELNKEIQNIVSQYSNVRFIISGRNSSFIGVDIFPDSTQLYLEKHFDYDDVELRKLMYEYENTPIADLLPIPIYRNSISGKEIPKNTTLEELYNILVIDSLKKDKKRQDYSNNVSSRMTSEVDIDVIINKISIFCYELFIAKRNIFTENELKECLRNENHFIFFINSSIIDYRDENTISFISNFYYEYFIANALLNKDTETVDKFFFYRKKVRIPNIDILMLFMNLAKTKSINLYEYIRKKLLKYDVACVLICEFDLLSDNDRYKYFISIFKEYKKKNKWIRYYQFSQEYGALKNISNIVLRMQQLLKNTYKIKAINFLKSEIVAFLKKPSKYEVLTFYNAVILLSPFIENLWNENERASLREISLPLIKFFLYNDISKEIENLLSEERIFDWYCEFNWTKDWKQKEWELFYKDISGNSCNLGTEIVNDKEYDIKFNFLSYSNNDEIFNLLLLPILRYATKNKNMEDRSIGTTVPREISDDFVHPMIKTDRRNYELLRVLKKVELSFSDILDYLIFTMENLEHYHYAKNSYDSPIKIMEEKLYKKISAIENKDYEKFSQYYFNAEEFDFDERLFKSDNTEQVENLKVFLVDYVIDRKIDKWRTSDFLYTLIDFNNAESSLVCLDKIKKDATEKIYNDIIFYVSNSKEHILKTFVTDEYNELFKEYILDKKERDKKLENIEKEIESVKNNDINLMLDPKEMIAELRKIDKYLSSPISTNKKEEPFHNLCSLEHQTIKRELSYKQEYSIPPIFSEYAIELMKDFYRSKTKIFDIEKIITHLQGYLFEEENFYVYFYMIFVDNSEEFGYADIKDKMNTNAELCKKILNSMDKYVSNMFLNKPVEHFEYDDRQWLNPFLYYYKTLLKNIPPKWMKKEHILKLIAVPTIILDEKKENLNWIIEEFPEINATQIIEYGLKIINSLKCDLSKEQIVKYFINYYKSNEQNEFSEEILNFIINSTKKLFDLTNNSNICSEFGDVAYFWTNCNSNHIDNLFPKFTAEIIISTIKTKNKNNDYYYREQVLSYCGRIADDEQKIRIINEIESDLANKTLSEEENNKIHEFLAFLGNEKSIWFIINEYLQNDKKTPSRHSSEIYSLGFIKQSNNLLNDFINLLIYSKIKHTERRDVLSTIAQNGIKQHLTEKNFNSFEKRIIAEIKKHRKEAPWTSNFYEEFLLQMEQLVY